MKEAEMNESYIAEIFSATTPPENSARVDAIVRRAKNRLALRDLLVLAVDRLAKAILLFASSMIPKQTRPSSSEIQKAKAHGTQAGENK